MRRILAPDDRVVACVDGSGIVSLGPEPGEPAGLVRGNETFADLDGTQRLCIVEGGGAVLNDRYESIGNVDGQGRVTNEHAAFCGRVEEPADAGVLLCLVRDQVALSPETPAPHASLMDELLDEMSDAPPSTSA